MNSNEHSKLIFCIALFSVVFFALQIIDLALTKEALLDPRVHEANPLYTMEWFVLVKLSVILIIAPMVYGYGRKYPGLAYSYMAIITAFYIFVVINNAWLLHLSQTT